MRVNKIQFLYIGALFALVFSLGLIWAIITPANNEAPDEKGHMAMIYFLRDHKKIPVFDRENDIEQFRFDPRLPSGAYYSMAYNSPISYLPFIPFAQSRNNNIDKRSVLPSRVIASLFMALFAVFLFLALLNIGQRNNQKGSPRQPRDDPSIYSGQAKSALSTSIFIALIPQVIFSASYVNIEPIALLFSAISFYFVTQIIKRESIDIKDHLALGVSLGLLGLCKANYLVFVAFCFIVLIINIAKSKQRKKTLAYFAISFAIFIVINIWWWLRNLALYNDPIILGYIKREIATRAPEWFISKADQGSNIVSLFLERDFLKLAFYGFFANLGGASILLPSIFYLLFFAVVILALLILSLRALAKQSRDRFGNLAMTRELIWLPIALSIFTIVNFASKNLYDYSPQGRHLFPLLIPLSLIIYFAILQLKNYQQKIAGVFLIIFSALSSIWGLISLIDQYFVRGIAYSNIENSKNIVNNFFWRPFQLSNYQNLIEYIVKDNPTYLQNITLVLSFLILVISLIVALYFVFFRSALLDKSE